MGYSISDDFNGLKKAVGTLIGEVEGIKSDAATVASEASSSLAAIQFGSWTDDVASNLSNYRDAVKAGMDEVVSNLSGGGYTALKDALTDLESGLGQCSTYKDRYFYQCDRLRFVNDEDQRKKIIKYRDAEKKNLEKCISFCDSVVSTISSIVYNGTVTYTPGGGASGLEDNSALLEDSMAYPEYYKGVTAEQLDSIPEGAGIVLYDSKGNKYTFYRDAGNGDFNMVDSEGHLVGVKSAADIITDGEWNVRVEDKAGIYASAQTTTVNGKKYLTGDTSSPTASVNTGDVGTYKTQLLTQMGAGGKTTVYDANGQAHTVERQGDGSYMIDGDTTRRSIDYMYDTYTLTNPKATSTQTETTTPAQTSSSDSTDATTAAPTSTTPKETYTGDSKRYHFEGTEKGLKNVLVLTDTDTGYRYDGSTSIVVGKDLYFSSDQSEGYAMVEGLPMHFRRGLDGYYYFDGGTPISGNPRNH